MQEKKITHSEKETIKWAERWAKKLKPGSVLGLIGELGSGKTVFSRGIARGLGIPDPVTSPTFNLLQVYQGRQKLFHFDLYRLQSQDELAQIGYEEFFFGQGIVLVEWADKFMDLLPEKSYLVRFRHIDRNTREIEITQR